MKRLALIVACAWIAPCQTFVFEDVTVIPMDRERTLPNQSVVVKDGRIVSVGRAGAVKAPADATQIDGKGKYLMPGLAEMHGHLPPPGTPRNVVENILFLYVANGVTTVRGMQGQAEHLAVRKEIEDGKLLGPKLYVAGPGFSGQAAPSVEAARKMVQEQKAAGFDHLKIMEGMTREVYDAVVAEARKQKITFAGHVPNDVGVPHALDMRQTSIDHLDNYIDALTADGAPMKSTGPVQIDENKITPLAKKTRDQGVWTVPTMALWEIFNNDASVESLLAWPEIKYMPRQTVEQWSAAKTKMLANTDLKTGAQVIEIRKKMLRALHEAGAKIALGTDSPQTFSAPGFSIHREMPIMVECGMTPFAVLRSGTRNVGEYFGALKDSGTVEKGKVADLILLEQNPLDNVANVAKRAGVMVRGQWLPESGIQERLAKIAAAN